MPFGGEIIVLPQSPAIVSSMWTTTISLEYERTNSGSKSVTLNRELRFLFSKNSDEKIQFQFLVGAKTYIFKESIYRENHFSHLHLSETFAAKMNFCQPALRFINMEKYRKI